MTDGIARFKDFTGDADPIRFKIRDEIFTCLDDIPIARIGELAKIANSDDVADMGAKMLTLFQELLEEESFERFKSSILTGKPVVVGVTRIRDLVPWLLEQYGLRPTVPSSGSGTTSSESGGSSTDGALLVGSTS